MEQWEREEAKRHAVKALKESKEGLLKIIETWATAKRLAAFFADDERWLKGLAAYQRWHTMERLRLPHNLIGSIDALERLQSWKAPEER